ncbi:FKBP-type peptidyl-prolyl cis-trans isomerase N-terminal domain-containing protein [Phytobacter ursingii]
MLAPEPNILFNDAGDKPVSVIPAVPLLTRPEPATQAKSTVVVKKSTLQQTELSQLKRKLRTLQHELQALRKQNEALKNRQPDVATERADAFRDENKQLHQQLLASEKQLAENTRRYEKQLGVLAARTEELQTQMTRLQLAANEAGSQKALLEQQLAKQPDSAKTVAAQAGSEEALATQLAHCSKQNSEQLEQLNSANNKIAEQLTRLGELEQQAKKADEEKKQALASLSTLQKDRDAAALERIKAKQTAYSLKTHKSEESKINYAYGAYYAVKVPHEFKALEYAGHKFLPLAFQQGFKDKLANTMQLNEEEVGRILSRFDQQVAEVQGRERDRNKKQSIQFVERAAKVKGAEQAPNGVVYLVVKKGKPPLLTVNDTIRFRLDEKISTGKKMSGGEIRVGRVSKLPEVMQQGVLRVGSGGKVRITVPIELAYGEQGIPGTVPPGVASEITMEILGMVK